MVGNFSTEYYHKTALDLRESDQGKWLRMASVRHIVGLFDKTQLLERLRLHLRDFSEKVIPCSVPENIGRRD